MDNRAQNTLVGLFVLGGFVCLGILIVKFGEVGIYSGYVVKAQFGNDMPSLREGTEVSMSGKVIGRVSGVELDERNNPIVSMQINDEETIFMRSDVQIITSLMGQPRITIWPPDDATEPLPKNWEEPLSGTVSGPLDNLIDPELMETITGTTDQIRDLAEALKPAAEAFTEMVERRTIEDVAQAERDGRVLPPNLYTTVNRMHNVLQHLEDVVGDPDNQQNLEVALANLREATEEAKTAIQQFSTFGEEVRVTAGKADALIENVNTRVDGTYAHIDNLGRKSADILDQLSELLDHLDSAGNDLARGDGTVGLLLRDPELYESLLLTTQRLGEAAAELNVLLKKWQEKGLFAR